MLAIGIAVAIAGTALVWLVHQSRPAIERERTTAEAITAGGECAECHTRSTPGIVRQFVGGPHSVAGVTCLDCHKARAMSDTSRFEHRGYEITTAVTSGACAECHVGPYNEFARSRHGAPAWTAVTGNRDFTEQQLEFARQFHPGAIDRPANALARIEGNAASAGGCEVCHQVGRPNHDGSVGKCSVCHVGHEFSVQVARQPGTCGSCHMGPDHSQIEIWTESKHGVVFNSRRDKQDLTVPSKDLTAWDMDAPTCATCHMSGMGAAAVTHDVGERLTYYLFAAISKERPGAAVNKQRMQGLCSNCHAKTRIGRFYETAEAVLHATNEKVARAQAIYDGLAGEGLLKPGPFNDPADFLMFDIWHYYGRTTKHGAYMGGADFVQWHGNYELELKTVELSNMAHELRRGARRQR